MLSSDGYASSSPPDRIIVSENRYKRAGRVLVFAFVAYGVLVGTNLGEFWPASIYPMFSQGGIPWSRAAVRDVTDVENVSWSAVSTDGLPGDPYPLLKYGVDPIDLANFVSKTKSWDDERVAGLRKMFGEQELAERNLLVMRVNGRITSDDSVKVVFVPYALLTVDGNTLNEDLPR